MDRARIHFVLGTDTGVGKTVFSAWAVRWFRQTGWRVRAAKPVASGGREDARRLWKAMGGGRATGVGLDSVNPWWFRAALTPLVAARREGRRVELPEVVTFLRAAADAEVLVVEGAGGLRSPLGEGWDARDLLVELGAEPVLVAANRLGVLNQVRLTLESLPSRWERRTRVALMAPPAGAGGVVARSNAALLGEWLGVDRVVGFPWARAGAEDGTRLPRAVVRGMEALFGRGGKGGA